MKVGSVIRLSVNHRNHNDMEIMELPGGLLINGLLRRDFRFKPLTGYLERLISESGLNISSLAEQITTILSYALESVAGSKVNIELVRLLSSGDRQYLMQRLHYIIDPNPKWVTTHCEKCDEKIQFQLATSSLPVKPANESYPQAIVSLSKGTFNIRAPTGADEEVIARNTGNNKKAVDILLSRLISSRDDKFNIKLLSDEDKDLIDRSLDEMSPQVGEVISITCPYCECNQQYLIDNYSWIIQKAKELEEQVHTIALQYHWSEKEILSLPKYRRQHYIQLIDRSAGQYCSDSNNKAGSSQ